MTLKYRELKRRYELDGAEKTVSHLSESLNAGHLQPEEFSIRDLAEALVPDGREWVRMLDPRSAGGVSVLESGGAVDVTAFLNITGQVIYSKIMEAYQQEAFVVSKLVSTIPTRLDGEKIPGIARVSDTVDEVGQGMPYPHLGFGEDYIETPSTTKRGFIVPVTKEAIFLTVGRRIEQFVSLVATDVVFHLDGAPLAAATLAVDDSLETSDGTYVVIFFEWQSFETTILAVCRIP